MPQVNINYQVSHIRQQDMNYCWACAFAMVKGRTTWQAALDIAALVPLTARNEVTGSLTDPPAAARAARLQHHPLLGGILTPDNLASFMSRGAVAVFGRYRMESRTVSHVMVCSLLRGDTSNVNTLRIGVDDPWANGTRWTGTWTQFYGPKLLEGHAIVSK